MGKTFRADLKHNSHCHLRVRGEVKGRCKEVDDKKAQKLTMVESHEMPALELVQITRSSASYFVYIVQSLFRGLAGLHSFVHIRRMECKDFLLAQRARKREWL